MRAHSASLSTSPSAEPLNPPRLPYYRAMSWVEIAVRLLLLLGWYLVELLLISIDIFDFVVEVLLSIVWLMGCLFRWWHAFGWSYLDV